MKIQTFTNLLILNLGLLLGSIPALNAQSGNTVTVSGRVYGPDGSYIIAHWPPLGLPIDVPLQNDGSYSIQVPEGANVSLRPYFNADPLNGVSTFDQVLLTRHVSNVQPITDPIRLIAADIDHDEQITLNDTFDLRRLILGFTNDFPNNTSWRFVRRDYLFPNPQAPWGFPESVTLNNVTAPVTGLDFLGIKVGDLNGNADGTEWIPYPNYFGAAIQGNVKFDTGDCIAQATETGLGGWNIRAKINSAFYYTVSNSDGSYFLPVPPGSGTVEAIPPNAVWQACAPALHPVSTSINSISTVDIPMRAVASCPAMEVTLGAPFLRRCFTNTYRVNYCNKGSVPAEMAKVVLDLDPLLYFSGADLPHTLLINGNDTLYQFELGAVPAGYCGGFNVQFVIDCDAEFGQTHCSEASITPDTICGVGTQYANLQVNAECDGEDVIFTITNTGADMTQPVNYVVVEDIVVQMTGGPIQLDNGESEVITVPANGATWRLELEQPENHPWAEFASAMIEGCGSSGSGTVTLGIIPQFQPNDEAPFTDIDCQQNIGAYDPNDKQGFPLGTGAEHAIRPGQALDYLIRFQNTGTDTAFNVIVLDTLPTTLDWSSLQFGGSSHPCEFRLQKDGIVQAVFKNIMLPDSNVNEAASHGFFKFHIRQTENLPIGATIENRAGIYFDFNPPVITNTSLHTIRQLLVGTRDLQFRQGYELEIFPNPSNSECWVRLKSANPTRGTLTLHDQTGRLVLRRQVDHNLIALPVRQFDTGVYFLRLENENGEIGSGKLLVGER